MGCSLFSCFLRPASTEGGKKDTHCPSESHENHRQRLLEHERTMAKHDDLIGYHRLKRKNREKVRDKKKEDAR